MSDVFKATKYKTTENENLKSDVYKATSKAVVTDEQAYNKYSANKIQNDIAKQIDPKYTPSTVESSKLKLKADVAKNKAKKEIASEVTKKIAQESALFPETSLTPNTLKNNITQKIKSDKAERDKKTLIGSVDYDEDVAKLEEIRKRRTQAYVEKEKAQNEWDKWENSEDINGVQKALDYVGNTYVNDLRRDLDNKASVFETIESEYILKNQELAEKDIQRKYGMTGSEYISMLEEKEKSAESDSDKEYYKSRINKVRQRLYGKSNVFEHLGNIVKEGLLQANKGYMATADFFLGTPAKWLGFENNVFSQANRDATQWLNEAHQETYKSAQYLGDESNISGEAGTALIAAVPDLLLAMYTGVGSKATQLGSQAIAAANPTFWTNIQNEIIETAKSPIFYTSFIRQLGTNYEENLNSGEATEGQAALAAILASVITSKMEMGGFQSLGDELAETKGLWQKAYKWVMSGIEEGLEEPAQTSATNLVNKFLYDYDKKIVSLSEEDSVFNLKRAAKEFGIGTFVGMALGGGQLTFSGIINAKSDKQYKTIGKAASVINNVQELIDYAKSSPNDTVRTIARQVNANNITDADVGRIYQYAVTSVAEDFDTVETTEDLNRVVKDYFVVNVPLAIRDIASASFANKLVEMNIDADTYEGLTPEKAMGQASEQTENATVPKTETERELGFTEPTNQEIYREPTQQENDEALYGQRKTAKQRHILDVAKKLDSNMKVVFVDKNSKSLNGKNGKYNRNTNTMYIAKDLETNDIKLVEAYVEVFKHEFVHRLELRKAYNSFKNYLFKKSAAFEKYAKARLFYRDGVEIEYTRDEAINELVDMYVQNSKGDLNLTREQAEREAVADFIARTLFKDKTADFKQAIEGKNIYDKEKGTGFAQMDTDLELFEEMARTDRNLLQKIIDAIKDLIASIKGMPNLEKDLQYIEERLARVYQSADSKKSATESGEVYANYEDAELYQYIENALADNLPKKSFYKISNIISDELASDIEKIVGFSVKGYSNEIAPGNIKHIEKEHGINGKKDKSMSDHHDLAKIAFVINNYEKIKPGKMSSEYKNSDGTFAKTIELQKKINDEFYYVVEAVPDANLKTLHIVSAYKNKKDTFSDVPVSNDPRRYVQDEHQPNVSTNIIRNKNDFVNNNSLNEPYSSDNLDTEYLKAVENNDMETAQRMVDKAARKAGYPVKAYHGTSQGGFSVFDTYGGNFGLFGKGAYFTENKEVADSYQNKGKGNKKQTYSVFLSPSKTLDMDAKANIEEWKKAAPEASDYFENCVTNEDCFRELKEYCMDEEMIRWEAEEYITDVISYNMGYYSITHIGGGRFNKKDGTRHRVYIVFEPEQIKSADPVTYDDNGNVIPLSKRFNENEVDIRYSSDDLSVVQKQLLDRYENGELTSEQYLEESGKLWIKANEEYGSFPQGEQAQLNMPVPQKVAEDKPTERFVRTIIETDSLNDDMLKEMGEKVLLGDFSYKVISDESATKKADSAIENGTAQEVWNETVNDGKRITKNQIAIGEKLLTKAIDDGNTKRVLELSAELADIFTRAGQVVQAARLLKKMTGAGRLVSLQRTVKTFNKDLRAKYGVDYPPIKISEESAKRLAEAKTASGVEYAYQNVLQEVADQMPSTFLDKWNAWRYFAMLSNPKTHIRNLLGNALFIPAIRIKDALASGMELTVSQDKRTKSLVIKKEYSDFAKRDAKLQSVKNLLKGNKYNDKTAIREKQKIFKSKVLNFLTEFNSNALEAEDMLFKNIHYIHALAGYLQARKVDLNNVNQDILDDARIYAVEEAKKATFNDESALANAIQRFGNKNFGRSLLVEGVLPFKRTPINIIKRGIEYSPMGLGKTLTKGIYDVKKGKISPSEFIDGLASGLTGTGIMLVGMWLASIGAVSGGEKDDDESQFEKWLGKQEYAIEFGGKSYTIDWLAPANIPFFIGVEIFNTTKDSEEFTLSQFSNAVWNSLEPITNLSMLSGMQSVIESARYAEPSQVISSIAVDALTSYGMQAAPSLSGAIARTVDSKQRSWYIDKNDKLLDTTAQTIKSNIQSKIPGLTKTQTPKIDIWGREVSRGGVGERILENFVSPGYYSKMEITETSEELKRIFKETDVDVFPNLAEKSFAVDKETKYLTADEYVTYAKAKGNYSFDYLKEFMENSSYKRLTDAEKADVITDLYKYANAKAKTTVSDYDLMKSFKTVTNWERNGRSAVDYYIYQAINK